MTTFEFVSLMITGVTAIIVAYQTMKTRSLTTRVEYLTRELDQELVRLERARELIRSALEMFLIARQRINGVPYEHLFSTEQELRSRSIQHGVTLIEMAALAKVIDDDQLLKTVSSVNSVGTTRGFADQLPEDVAKELIKEYEDNIALLGLALKRVYELKDEATQSSK